ncbi:MAG: ABC transporter substrate-binding protein [Pseudonocardiaceae bacterium]
MSGSAFRFLRRGIALFGAAVLAASCAGTQPDDATAGPGRGKITVLCGATEDWCTAHTTAFTKNTGIEAGFVRLSSGEAVARLQAGKSSPEFSVWHGGPAEGYVVAANAGLLEPYISPNASAIRSEWKAPDGSWTGVYVAVLGFCSNTKRLAEKGLRPPTSWAELLDPRYAKDIGVAHPGTSGTGYVTLWTQVALAGGDKDRGLAYLRSLRPNVLQFAKSGLNSLYQAWRGEIATGVLFSHDCVASREGGFTDLEVTFPAEGAGYEVGGLAVIKGGLNTRAAKAYVDWALTAEAQEIGATVKSYQVPTLPNAKISGKSVTLDQIKLVDYDFAAAGAAKPELVKRFDAEIASAPGP